MKIALCMIMKNEAAVLERCLKSFKLVVDEIHIADTGSTDDSVEIARKHGAIVKFYEEEWGAWDDENTGVLPDHIFDTEDGARAYIDRVNATLLALNPNPAAMTPDAKATSIRPLPFNYARARNFAQEGVQADVIFSVDADEYLHPDSQKVFRSKIKEYFNRSDSVLIPIWAGYNDRLKNPAHIHHLVRCFRKGLTWHGRIHEVVHFNNEKRLMAKSIILLHDKRDKKMTVEDHKKKIELYMQNLELEAALNPNSPRPLFYLGNTCMENPKWHKPEEAIEYYVKYLLLSKWHEERCQALINMGKCYMAMKSLPEAKLCFIRAACEDQRRVEPWFYLGDVTNGENPAEGARFYEIATKYEGKMPDSLLFLETAAYSWLPWYRLSVIYSHLNNFEAGAKATDRALTLMDPKHPMYKDMEHNRDFYRGKSNSNAKPSAPVSNKPVNIIIPSATAELLGRCYESIIKAKTAVPYFISVVADGIAVEPDGPLVEVRPGVKPFIFARNINQALKPTCDNVIMNDDAEVACDFWLDNLQRAAYDKKLGIVSPLITDVGNPNQHISALDDSLFWKSEENMLCFVCVYIPRQVVVQVGALDEAFNGYGYEDNDYCWRARNNGFYLKICHTAVVKHERHSTFSKAFEEN